jgi:hypothetical protein
VSGKDWWKVSLVMSLEQQIREQFGEFDCGCDNRKEIMSAGNWQLDAIVVASALALVALAIFLAK